jgi:hypothetical protein
MVMGERIKRTTREATAKANPDTGSTAAEGEATERDAAPAANTPPARDNGRRRSAGAG